jgi:CheY-like chemotaxis protein
LNPDLPSCCVLIADPSATRRARLSALLRAQGHRLIESETGPTALRMLRGDNADVALLHVNLPGMDGLHVLAEFRKHRNDVAILLMSSDASIAEARAAFHKGGDDYLPLPLSDRELAEKLREAYQRREAIVSQLFQRMLVTIDGSVFAIVASFAEAENGFSSEAHAERYEPRG